MSAPKSRIMYIQRGSLEGPGRIGRVTFSKSGRTVHYQGRSFYALSGAYKATHGDEETHEEYWISGPRKDGQDTLYPGKVEIDDDVREEYWRDVRGRPDLVDQTSFRSMGKHAK